ncbi:MAG: hypothetical protein IPO49_10830 [Bacteroidetes bacterium]|jgi:hypothetical protein|nr:hypothetical protein [Bacteroidota bacterium]MBK9542784.1 hypothetical protein [Bacteroidota bacterium]MBP6402875.1 hypothetical protein [Bacteroidia bacterium]MBP6650207.1 hypothetical protein [Bacteroidia bacterium]
MRKQLFLLSFLVLFSAIVFAQENKPPVRERLESLKVGFLTERLNLSAEEAKVFWPVYNKYQDELEQLRKSRRENLMNAKLNFDEMSDSEVEKTIDNELMYRQGELDVLKKYNPQFKKVLPVKKVAKLYKAEEDFKRKLIDMIQDRKEERRQDKRELRGR